MPFRSSKVLLPIAIILGAVVIAAGLFFSKPAPKVVSNEQVPLLVDAIEVAKEDVQISVRAQGTVMPRTATTLVAEVSGRVVKVADNFKVGAYFKSGDPLLYIDERDYKAQLKRAEAAVASAQSLLATEKGRAEVAYQDWLKYRSSVKRSDAANDLALRKPQLAEAQAQLDSATADLEHARDQMERTVIRAPYDGLVRSKQVDIGQYVNIGTQLADTFAVDVAELRLAIPQHKLAYLELPTLSASDRPITPAVKLYAEIGDSLYQWSAKVVRTESVFDERSRSLFAVAEITDPYGIETPREAALRIGTFVEAQISGRTFKDLVVLPRRILRAGNRIWVIDQKNQLQNRTVSVLRTDGTDIYVTSGLDNGERVCASTIPAAIPGTKVRIAKQTPSNQSPPASDETLPEIDPPRSEPSIDVAPATTPRSPDKSATAPAAGDETV